MPAIAGSRSSTSIVVEGYRGDSERGTQANIALWIRLLSDHGDSADAGREFGGGQFGGTAGSDCERGVCAESFSLEGIALGRHLGGADRRDDTRIVGVVKDAKYASMREAPPPVFYLPLEQRKQWGSVFYYLRTAIDPEQVFGA
jgi:hypothetical protein